MCFCHLYGILKLLRQEKNRSLGPFWRADLSSTKNAALRAVRVVCLWWQFLCVPKDLLFSYQPRFIIPCRWQKAHIIHPHNFFDLFCEIFEHRGRSYLPKSSTEHAQFVKCSPDWGMITLLELKTISTSIKL